MKELREEQHQKARDVHLDENGVCDMSWLLDEANISEIGRWKLLGSRYVNDNVTSTRNVHVTSLDKDEQLIRGKKGNKTE